MTVRSPRLLLNAALMLALVIAVLTLVDVNAVFSAVQEIQPELLVLTLLLLSADRVAMGLKWRHLIRGAGAKIRASTAISAYYQSGFAALLLPTSIAGEVIRGVLGRRAGVPGQVVVASMVVEKLVAAVSNLTLAGAAATFIWLAGSDQEMGAVARLSAIPVLVVVAVLATAGNRKVHEQTGRFLHRCGSRSRLPDLRPAFGEGRGLPHASWAPACELAVQPGRAPSPVLRALRARSWVGHLARIGDVPRGDRNRDACQADGRFS